jgi:uncharacterized protein YneF (UPF0154 family)
MSLTMQIFLWSVFVVGTLALLCIMIGMAVLFVFFVRETMNEYKRNNPRR